ncbi:MAG TPA: 2-amino-4-hydroxy-6-hydroxymethyldihydropteridine diphosphokinase [Planctomycetota bacterium]
MSDAFVALGSNLGDRRGHLRWALRELGRLPHVRVAAVSRLRETEPVGGPPQPHYLNGVVRLESALPPRSLLHQLQILERRRGRCRAEPDGPRTLDLDLLLCGALRTEDPELTLPHPRMESRRFVLEPLHEIAPQLRLGAGRTPSECLSRLAP